jgi:hypothetical protein
VSDESVESHNGASITAARSSRSCCNCTSPTRGIDVSVGTSVDSVDEATVESVDEATVDEVDEATVDEVDEATLVEVDEATVDEVDEATVDEVEVLVDVVVAG